MHKIAKHPRLDHVTALQAVADYQLVVSRGALGQLQSELPPAYREAEINRQRRPVGAYLQTQLIARELARLLNLDSDVLVPAVESYFMGDDRTATALQELRVFAERLRRDGKGVQ